MLCLRFVSETVLSCLCTNKITCQKDGWFVAGGWQDLHYISIIIIISVMPMSMKVSLGILYCFK